MNKMFLTNKQKKLAILIFLTLIVIIVYFNSFNNTFISDDIASIVDNKDIGNFSWVLSRPFGFVQPLIYFIAFSIGGLNPFFFRMFNILFHIGTVWLIFLIIDQLFFLQLAFFVAIIFAVHPILTESVTWISGITYINYSFFFLLSFLMYILAKKKPKLYIISVISYFVSINAGVPPVILSSVFFIYELVFGNINKNWKKLIPFFIISIFGFIIFFSRFLYGIGSLTNNNQQEKQVFLNPLIQIPIAITYYLQLIIWPDKLTLYHTEMIFSIKEYIARLIGFMTLIGFIVYSYKKNKAIFFWLVFFIISMIPTSTPFKVSWIVAERYVYLGTIGIIFVFSYFLAKLVKNKKTEVLGYFLFIIVLLSLMGRTITRNIDWKNADNLWLATAKTSPHSYVNHNNLGDVYGRHKDFQRAISEFKLAIQLKPDYWEAYNNMGNTYRQMGLENEALRSYEQALKINRLAWPSALQIAAIYFKQGKYDLSLDFMKLAIRANPTNSTLYYNLGLVYLKIGNKKNAEDAFLTALRLDPSNQQAKLGLSEL